MIKRKMRLLTGLLAVMLCCAALTPAAFAYADDPETEETAGTVQETDTPEDDVPVTGGAEPLTPEGNLTLVDDIQGEAAGDKQFITVQTKAGNTFYIIIDRAADGENTVYFLNAVDEADLTALMEDGEPAVCDCTTKCAAGAVDTACPVCAVNMTECVGPEPEPEPEPTPEPVEEPAEGIGWPQPRRAAGGPTGAGRRRRVCLLQAGEGQEGQHQGSRRSGRLRLRRGRRGIRGQSGR